MSEYVHLQFAADQLRVAANLIDHIDNEAIMQLRQDILELKRRAHEICTTLPEEGRWS